MAEEKEKLASIAQKTRSLKNKTGFLFLKKQLNAHYNPNKNNAQENLDLFPKSDNIKTLN